MAVKCDYHPEANAVGTCLNCQRPVCIECKVVLGGETYCSQCADKLFVRADKLPDVYKVRYVNWFEQHLNLTMFVAWGMAFFVSFFAGFILAGIKPDITETQLELVGLLIGLMTMLPVGGWVLQKKNRNVWWLVLLVIPFGFIPFLLLENRSGKKPVSASSGLERR